MERETIERLAVDRALGELDADTTALFEAYLADHTEAQVWAQAMSQACGRTREAIHRRTQTVASVPHIPTAIATRLAWGAPARWAAVILISLGLGATADDGRNRKLHPRRPSSSEPSRAGRRRVGERCSRNPSVAFGRPRLSPCCSHERRQSRTYAEAVSVSGIDIDNPRRS